MYIQCSLSAMAGGYGDCMEGIAALSVWDSRLVCIYSVHSLLWLVGMGTVWRV